MDSKACSIYEGLFLLLLLPNHVNIFLVISVKLFSRGFFLSGFSFTNIHDSQDSREGGGYLFKSSLPFPPASQTLRRQPDDYCRELTSAHRQQPDSNREPLVSLSYAPSNVITYNVRSCVIRMVGEIKQVCQRKKSNREMLV